MRNDLRVVLPSLIDWGDLPGFAEAWSDHQAAEAVHAAMELGIEGAGLGAIAMFDHYLGGAVAGPRRFAEERAQERSARLAVSAAIGQGPGLLSAALSDYQVKVEAHLELKEAVIVPLVRQLPPKRELKFTHWCLAAGWAHGGVEHFVAHGVASLATHGGGNQSPVVASRWFLQSLFSVCTPVHWTVLQPVAQAAAHGPTWEVISSEVPLWASLKAG